MICGMIVTWERKSHVEVDARRADFVQANVSFSEVHPSRNSASVNELC